MTTVRVGVFETNSSSCHAFSIFNKKDWEDFKNNGIFIRSDAYSETSIHTTVMDAMVGEDRDSYFISASDYLENVYDEVSQYFDNPLKGNSHRYSSYVNSTFDEVVDEYIKNNLSINLLKIILTHADDEVLVELDKPISEDYSRYYSDGKDHIVVKNIIRVYDAYDRIFGYGRSRFEFEDVQVYGDGEWKPEYTTIKEFISKDDSSIILIERKIQD